MLATWVRPFCSSRIWVLVGLPFTTKVPVSPAAKLAPLRPTMSRFTSTRWLCFMAKLRDVAALWAMIRTKQENAIPRTFGMSLQVIPSGRPIGGNPPCTGPDHRDAVRGRVEGAGQDDRQVPGAVGAVVLSIILSAALDASSHGVAIVGAVQGGFPPIGLPQGITWSDIPQVLGIAFSCFVLIIAQSAATSRSFAMRHNQRVDINRDIVGLSAASFAAGLTGTFVVNGSPTKTQILDEQKGRTQVANMTMSLVVLVVVLFLTGLLTDMPKAVLAAIVFLIGIGLIDIKGLRRILAARPSEFVIAVVTAVVVFAVGVEQGIVLAIVLSIAEIVRRAYGPKDFLVGVDQAGELTYLTAEPGHQSMPGLLVFRFDAELFFANASRFSDEVFSVLSAAPTPVRWLVLDCSSLDDVDYSAGLILRGIIDSLHADGRVFALAGADPQLLGTLKKYGTLSEFDNTHIYSTVQEAVAAFRDTLGAPSSTPTPEPQA